MSVSFGPHHEVQKNFIEVLTSNLFPMFSTLVACVQQAGLVDVLSTIEGKTILCPTNLAFKRCGFTIENNDIYLNGKVVSKNTLKKVLMGHVIDETSFGNTDQMMLPSQGSAKNLNGQEIDFVTDTSYRTTITSGNSQACILMPNFISSNVSWVPIGRVLL